jgi:hypothetical protein
MTLNDYLETLKDKDRAAFAKRVSAIGSPTVDAFSASLPSWYKDARNSFDVDSVHAVYFHEGPGSSKHYHILMLDYQYAYWVDAKPKPDWLKAASKADKAVFKATAKSDATIEDGPRHVFGSSVYDPDDRVLIYPGTKTKQPIEVGAIGEKL